MRVVRTYESFNEFDIDFVMAKIKSKFSKEDVKKMIDDEIDVWSSDAVSKGEYDDKDKWYNDLGIGSIDDVIIDQIIDWYENEFKMDLTGDQKTELSKKLLSAYDLKH